MWELAPGSPWNTIFLRWLMRLPVRARRIWSQYSRLLFHHSRLLFHQVAHARQIFRRVDVERLGADQRHVDAHAGLERAQLLEPLALLQRRGRQRDEAFERRAAIGVKPEVVIERPLPPWRGGAGEIER